MASLDVQKTKQEEIIKPIYWPKEYREGFSEYHIEGYDENRIDESWIIRTSTRTHQHIN